MMKNLFLTSSFKDVVPLFTEFESNLKEKPLLLSRRLAPLKKLFFM